MRTPKRGGFCNTWLSNYSNPQVILENLQAGTFSARALGRTCKISREMARKLLFVIAEAIRQINREFFNSDGVVLSLNQDARGRWLCVRFVGCNDALERRQGLLGFVDLLPWIDTFAENLPEATVHAINMACRPGSFKGRSASRSSDGDVHDDIITVLSASEVYNADGAADEQLNGALLEGIRLEDLRLDPPLLPNVKIVNRDRAHAARTFCKRGWGADRYLQKVHQGVVGKGCWMQKIQRSEPLQQVFHECIVASAQKVVASSNRKKDTTNYNCIKGGG